MKEIGPRSEDFRHGYDRDICRDEMTNGCFEHRLASLCTKICRDYYSRDSSTNASLQELKYEALCSLLKGDEIKGLRKLSFVRSTCNRNPSFDPLRPMIVALENMNLNRDGTHTMIGLVNQDLKYYRKDHIGPDREDNVTLRMRKRLEIFQKYMDKAEM